MPKFKLIDNSIVFIEDKNVEEFLSQNPGAVQVSAVEENAMKNDGSYYKMLEQETGRRVGDVNAISGRAKTRANDLTRLAEKEKEEIDNAVINYTKAQLEEGTYEEFLNKKAEEKKGR